MRNDHNENSVAATGIGAVLASVLSKFARSADDVARMGVHCVDDVGRACVTTSDDIGAAFARSGDDLFRPIDDFHVANHVDDLRFEPAPPRIIVHEGDDGISVSAHITKEVAEATIKAIDLNDDDN